MKSKKFLFISNESLSGDLALQLLREGHKVKFYFKDRYSKDVYNGLLDKINAWGSCQKWADIIIFDDECYGFLRSHSDFSLFVRRLTNFQDGK